MGSWIQRVLGKGPKGLQVATLTIIGPRQALGSAETQANGFWARRTTFRNLPAHKSTPCGRVSAARKADLEKIASERENSHYGLEGGQYTRPEWSRNAS